VEKIFVDSWDGDYAEAPNILPSANILDNGGFNYSDGIMIAEALDPNNNVSAGKQPQFFDLTDGGGFIGAASSNVQVSDAMGNRLPVERFVRFSHNGSVDFFDEFNTLSTAPDPNTGRSEQEEFRLLARALLAKIDVNGRALGTVFQACAMGDIPWV
jgi:hypothetical protein